MRGLTSRWTSPRSMLLVSAALIASPAQADINININIGVVLSLTGPGASLSIPENDTIKMWPTMMGGG